MSCSDDVLAALTAANMTADQANAICSSFLAASDGVTLAQFQDLQYGVDVAWLVLCGALVFIMHGGFAMVSSLARLLAEPAGTLWKACRSLCFCCACPTPDPGQLRTLVCTAGAPASWRNRSASDVPLTKSACSSHVNVTLYHTRLQLCAGAIRSKNTLNILLQTILDACVSGILWYCVGYAFAWGVGDPPNRFIGNSMFALKNLGDAGTGTGIGKWSDVVRARIRAPLALSVAAALRTAWGP